MNSRRTARHTSARESFLNTGFHHVLLDALPIGVCLIDGQERIVSLNAEAVRLLGISEEYAIGRRLGEVLRWSGETQTDCSGGPAIGEVLRNCRPSISGHAILHRRDGRERRVEWQCAPLPDYPDRVVLTLQDRSRQAELQRDRDRLARIADESPSPVVELDAFANLLYANAAMTDLIDRFGYTEQGFPAVFPPDINDVVRQCLASGQSLHQREVELPSASYVWSFCPAPSTGTVRGYAIDLTAVKAAERNLREINKELDRALVRAQEAVKIKNDFLATMSHELRTPLNGIQGMTELLLDTPLQAEQRSFAETIRQCGQALLRLINDILDLSKIEANKLELESIEFRIRALVDQVLAQFAETAQTKGLELAGLVHASIPETLVGDPGRLRQILTNLIGNAVKFTDRGEVVLEIQPTDNHVQENHRLARPDEVPLFISVKDTGIGIAPDVIDKLFRPFTQADTSTTRRYGGTGLGLSISKKLVELMGGTIGVTSEPGRGSTFWCTIRLAKPARPAEPARAGLGGRRVLIVDDNATNRLILHHLVSSWGMDAVLAAGAEEAIASLQHSVTQHRPFDVAILDVMMPGQDGIALTRRIKALLGSAAPPLIVLTSLIQRGQAKAAHEAGASAYLTKPVRHDQLFECLHLTLGAHSPVHPPSDESPPKPAADTPLITGNTVPASPRSPRVLVAEDNPVNQVLTVKMLERLGYRANVVSNGREAVHAIQQDSYDAILMDVQMPDMDGLEATQRIRAWEASNGPREASRAEPGAGRSTGLRIPIITITANAMPGDRDRCLAAGADDYLAKPMKSEDLRAVLERWIPSVGASEPNGLAHSTMKHSPEDIPLSVFDPRAMLSNIGGDTQLQQELIRLYLTSYQSALDQANKALAGRDPVQLEHAAHSLKGTAANLCARDLVRAAGQVEALSRLGLTEETVRACRELERQASKLATVLTCFLR
ncbi:MAG TPA: response regulator [Nitrospiraceae bacterium]|jgi:two-component system sensor histidine kinase/response regulator|nr:response regulator [Nitrospiraceae bacterium]